MTTRRTTTVVMKRIAAAIVVLVVSACAGIPSSGPVTRAAADKGFGQSTVRYAPAAPLPGASPQEIVRGFLDAMLAYPITTGTASSFLTPDAAKGWHSLAGVRVYSAPQVAAPVATRSRGTDAAERAGDKVTVQVSVVNESRLNEQGRYTEMSGNAVISFRLARVGAQWRITNPQDGLLVNRKFFSDYFRPFDIFMFDRSGRRLVPVPVYVAVGDQLATALVTSLARGPAPDPDDTTRTYVPDLKALRPSVPVTDGVADVQFDQEFSNVAKVTQDHLSAQIIWTLRQVPEIGAVRLVGGTTALSTKGLAAEPIGSWGAFGPSIARGHAYALIGNRVVQIDDGRVSRLSGTWGKDAGGAKFVAVNDEGVAGVLAGGSTVRVTNRLGASPRSITGSGLIAPRWDDDANLWLVDRVGGSSRLRLSHRGALRTLPVGRLAQLDISTFSLSPDAARYAVTVRNGKSSAVFVGMVRRDMGDRIVGLGDPGRLVTSTDLLPTSAVWATGTRLSFLGTSGSGRQVYTALIDGSELTGGAAGGGPLLPDVGADVMVQGTGQSPPRYATDARQRIWFMPTGGTWRLLDARGVTGLTYGH